MRVCSQFKVLRIGAIGFGLFTGVTFGQDLQFNLGLQMGVNVGSSSGAGTASSTRPMFGVFTDPAIGRNLRLQPELNYVGQGPGIDYLSIPVLIKYLFRRHNTTFRPFLSLGPEVALALSGANTKGVAIGIVLMGGAQYAINRSFSLYGAGRYHLGLTNTTTVVGGDAKLRNFNLLAGAIVAI